MEVALENGAEDIQDMGDSFEVVTEPANFETVSEALKKAAIPVVESSVGMIPQNTISISGDTAQKMLRLMENLEDHDDVQSVYANFDISEEEMEKFS